MGAQTALRGRGGDAHRAAAAGAGRLARRERILWAAAVAVTVEPWQPWHSVAAYKVRHILMGQWQHKLAEAMLLAIIGAVMGAAVVRAYGLDEQTHDKVEHAISERYKAEVLAHFRAATFWPMSSIFYAVALSTVIVLGSVYGRSWGLTFGQVSAFLFLADVFLHETSTFGVRVREVARECGEEAYRVLGRRDDVRLGCVRDDDAAPCRCVRGCASACVGVNAGSGEGGGGVRGWGQWSCATAGSSWGGWVCGAQKDGPGSRSDGPWRAPIGGVDMRPRQVERRSDLPGNRWAPPR